MKENIIGREQEIEKLENYISSRKSEFENISGTTGRHTAATSNGQPAEVLPPGCSIRSLIHAEGSIIASLTTFCYHPSSCMRQKSISKHRVFIMNARKSSSAIWRWVAWHITCLFSKTTETLIPTFVTPHGLYNNMYARKINRQVTGDDLF